MSPDEKSKSNPKTPNGEPMIKSFTKPPVVVEPPNPTTTTSTSPKTC